MPNPRTLQLTALSLALACLIAGAGLWRPSAVSAQAAADPAPGTEAFYTQKVQPILQANCYHCHGNGSHRGGLHIDSKAGLLKGGMDGAVIVPGHPEQSLLIKLIRHEGPEEDPMPMPPPPRTKVSDADIATVTAWIKAGAIMPDTQ